MDERAFERVGAARGGSPTPPVERTWQVTRRAAVTPLLSLALLAALLATCELAARSAAVRARLLDPSVDSPSRPFEQQLAVLDANARTGPIDCVFLGSSLVLTGLDPDVFAAAQAQAGGRPLRCVNLAVPGMKATDVAMLARIVAEDHHPGLLVYGASYRDFSAQRDGPELEALPWVRYRLGEWSPDGWLVDHSAAYRYYLAYRHWADAAQWQLITRGLDLAADGFWPRPPRQVDLAAEIDGARRAMPLAEQHVAAEQLAALDALGALRERGVAVLVIEMPGPLAFSRWLTATPTYRDFAAAVRQRLARTGVPYWETWQTVPPDVVGDDGWLDVIHMNTRGAAALSSWLGERIGHAAVAGGLGTS